MIYIKKTLAALAVVSERDGGGGAWMKYIYRPPPEHGASFKTWRSAYTIAALNPRNFYILCLLKG